MIYEEYSRIPALNWSSLKEMIVPLLFMWYQQHPKPDTEAYLIGRAVHTAVLEPDLFDEQYACKPIGMKFSEKAGKAWKAEHSDREILTPTQAATVRKCTRAIEQHGPAQELLSGDRREETIVWRDPDTGVPCKARVDTIDSMRLPDLKTTRDLEWFERDIAKFLYYGQSAFYLDGAITAGVISPSAESYIVAVQKPEPSDVGVFRLSQETLAAGQRLYTMLLDRWIACTEADVWPGRYPSVTTVELPSWAPGVTPDDESEGF
jgi:hypothetical protein